MRRALFALLVALTLGLALVPGIPAVRCFRRRRHNPVKHPLGGFRCADCGTAGLDLEQMGFEGGGYVNVNTLRTTYGRGRESGVTRSSYPTH